MVSTMFWFILLINQKCLLQKISNLYTNMQCNFISWSKYCRLHHVFICSCRILTVQLYWMNGILMMYSRGIPKGLYITILQRWYIIIGHVYIHVCICIIYKCSNMSIRVSSIDYTNFLMLNPYLLLSNYLRMFINFKHVFVGMVTMYDVFLVSDVF